jgi:hypothetical protein
MDVHGEEFEKCTPTRKAAKVENHQSAWIVGENSRVKLRQERHTCCIKMQPTVNQTRKKSRYNTFVELVYRDYGVYFKRRNCSM